MSDNFKGFPKPTRNYFTVPNIMIDNFAEITSLAELKVIVYLIRHTWGYQEYGTPKPITTDEFMNGRKHKDGSRIDKGTGLKSNKSVIEGLKLAEEHGYIVSCVDDSDKARIVKTYMLKMEDTEENGCVDTTHPSYVDTTHRRVDTTHQAVDSTHRSEKHTNRKTLNKKNTKETHIEAAPASKPQGDHVCDSSSPVFTELEETILTEWERIQGLPLDRRAGKLKEQVSFVASLIEHGKISLSFSFPSLIAKAEQHEFAKKAGGLNFAIFKHLLATQPALLKDAQEPCAQEEPASNDFLAFILANETVSHPENV